VRPRDPIRDAFNYPPTEGLIRRGEFPVSIVEVVGTGAIPRDSVDDDTFGGRP
jgi:hypothetical protein